MARILAPLAIWCLFLPLHDHAHALPRPFHPRRFLRAMRRGNRHENWNQTTAEMVIANGYPAETHEVVTQDGYILQLHRIPHGSSSSSSSSSFRPPILLHHCLLCSSSEFVMNTPDRALAYVLADAGYDVWLTNARGNTYSRNHVTLSPDEKAFWQFSWHEMGVYDLPAVIDHVLNVTGETRLKYLGFSMGTTVFWVMLSERPEYAKKVSVMAALGPVAYTQHVRGPLKVMAPFVSMIERSLSLFGQYELMSFGSTMDKLTSMFCNDKIFTSIICRNLLFLIAGPNPDRLNKKYLPVLLAHTPAGTSVHTVTHYLQLVRSGAFGQYNFGRMSNLAHYGSFTPPQYTLSHVTVPVGLFWSSADWLAAPGDVARLQAALPNVVMSMEVQSGDFSHLDFVWASDAKELVYTHVLEFLKAY
ncbi:lipase 3-like [Portunus trituberculatus]|uniref:lipase 3-like n=1 Tax=Portunus trituberculatus TaxID=210409 RepID=UPI001E1CC7DA|nr:lipase 3-like [Portunus trituberculatus]